ncbi:MAG TPA: hypothetical protein VHU80_17060 [Polyangiaceae bacterium]|nr:hypothetical protein [Polyangiaceae bacterium]
MARAQSAIVLTGPQRVRLAAESIRSERTVVRVYQGGGSDQSREAISRAARQLGMPQPPPTDSAVLPSSSPRSVT